MARQSAPELPRLVFYAIRAVLSRVMCHAADFLPKLREFSVRDQFRTNDKD